MSNPNIGGTDNTHEKTPPAPKQFCRRFPNEVTRDPRISAPTLVIIAYRATFIGSYGLNEKALRGIVQAKGFGRDVIERSIAEAIQVGYLTRRQCGRKPDGTFGYALDELCLPPAGATGYAGRFVARAWFTGILSVKELAALLFLRAGIAGRGRQVFARELAKRFNWSRPIANRIIAALLNRGFLEKRVRRNPDGTFRWTKYEVPRLAQDLEMDANVNQPGHGAPGRGSSGHILNPDLHTQSPTDFELPSRTKGMYTSHATRDEAPTILGDLSENDLHQQAMASPNLLGWIGTDQLSEAVEMDEVEIETLKEVTAVAPDAILREYILEATSKRVAAEIVSAAGLYAVRWLAATTVRHKEFWEAPTPGEALVAVLNGIWARVGSRPEVWLNSLGLIGQRMAAEAYRSGETKFYAADGKPMFRVTTRADRIPAEPKRTAATMDPSLQILLGADGAKTLAPKLRGDAAGLSVFLQKHGGAEALSIMVDVLRRHMIEGKPVSSVRSWRFFEAAIAEELHRRNVSAQGIRPGDAFGTHKWRSGTNA